MLQPTGKRQRRSRFLVTLLLLTLALTGVLAYQAYDAARSQRATAERAVRDYAAIAAFGLSKTIQDVLYSTLVFAFQPAETRAQASAGDSPFYLSGASATEPLFCRCLTDSDPLYYFDVRHSTGTAAVAASAGLGPELRRFLADSLRQRASMRSDGGWEVGLAFPGNRQGVAFALKRGADGGVQRAIGFGAPADSFGYLFARVVRALPMLPSSLVGGVPNDSILSVEVLTPAGERVYASPHSFPPSFAASEALPLTFGNLMLRVAIRPEAADMLIIGGLPGSRLPLLLGLLALTAGLVIVALLQLRREAELARLRDDFVSGVSHELRTPLAQIRMFTETLLLGRVRSEMESRRSLEIIDQEARRLAQLVENVLRFERAGRGANRVVPEETDLAQDVREIVESFRPLALPRKAELRTEIQTGIVVSVDRGALRQMVLNLMDNAVKYGPAGQRVTVGMALFGETVRLWVDDEGPGIAPADRDKIFAPFYRMDRDAGSAVAGSGIGLAVVRELVVLHGGRVWATDAPGGGARVALEIPGAFVRPAAVAEGDWVAA